MSLLETDVPIRSVVTTTPQEARALENDVRAKILDILVDREMTVGEIRDELRRRDAEKAETTVRHHVNVLRDAGLVELARLEEAGGATQKYYKSNTRVFAYELPPGSDETLAGVRDSVREELEGLIGRLYEEHGDAIEAVAREMQPCEYCARQHYEEFIVRTTIDRVLTEFAEEGSFDEFARDVS